MAMAKITILMVDTFKELSLTAYLMDMADSSIQMETITKVK